MKRVLITGAGGFMGSHVLRHILTKTDWQVICLDSFRHKGTTDRINTQIEGIEDAGERITVITHDLLAPISPQMAEKMGKVNYVLNIASESHVDRSIEAPRPFIENNVGLMLTMLEYARRYSIEKFVQISTDEVYGPAKDHDHEEWETLLPSNPYSASKAAQENIAFSYWRTFGVPLIITNTMNIIGELQDPEKFVPMTIKRILADEIVAVHGSADGETIGSRYYLHARNQADALLFILQNVPPLIYGGDVDRPAKYNIVGEKEITNLEMAQLIARYLSKPLKYKIVDFHSSRPGHDLRYGLNGKKMADLGWRAPMTFEESLRTTVDWTIGHPEWLK